MAEKKLKFILNGQEIVCNFGVNYFYKHFKEISGIDMLVNGLEKLKGSDMFDIIANIYCAGYFADCSLKKQDPVFTKIDFEDRILSLDETGAAKMLTDYTDIINTGNANMGEQQAQTMEPIRENL